MIGSAIAIHIISQRTYADSSLTFRSSICSPTSVLDTRLLNWLLMMLVPLTSSLSPQDPAVGGVSDHCSGYLHLPLPGELWWDRKPVHYGKIQWQTTLKIFFLGHVNWSYALTGILHTHSLRSSLSGNVFWFANHNHVWNVWVDGECTTILAPR